MYIPEHFAFSERDEILRFARRNNFATLVSLDGSMPYATHLPLIVRDDGESVTLEGHFARANPHRELLEKGMHLAIFHGPHAYISPTWYTAAGVPTWNYVAVHMTGTAEPVNEPDALRALVNELASIHEQGNASPWTPRYAPGMLAAISGFRLRVEKFEGKRKLSQNRSMEDRRRVVDALEKPFGREPDSAETGVRNLMIETNDP